MEKFRNLEMEILLLTCSQYSDRKKSTWALTDLFIYFPLGQHLLDSLDWYKNPKCYFVSIKHISWQKFLM